MAKPPPARGFTLAEKRALLFERIALYAVFLVAVIAAAISFVALRAVGGDAGLGRAAFLLPIAIDGFGIACSVGIVRSVASGDKFRERVSEWFGLICALGLSILGNVEHSLTVGAVTLPDYVKVAYATAIPVIVAYGIHVYGRAMSKGISAHVLADDPDHLRFDVLHLGEDTVARAAAPVRTPRAVRAPQAASSAPATGAPARATEAAPARADAQPPRAQGLDNRARMRELFDQRVKDNPVAKPDAAEMQRELGIDMHPATPRKWVQKWWEEHQASMGMDRPEPADPPAAAAEDDEGDTTAVA